MNPACILIIFFGQLFHIAISRSYNVDSSKLQNGDGSSNNPFNNLDDALDMVSNDNDASRTIILKSNGQPYKITTLKILTKSLVMKFEGSYVSDQATVFFDSLSGINVRKTFLTFENIIFNQEAQTLGGPILLRLEEEASLNLEVII
jgi:hypothetical protein